MSIAIECRGWYGRDNTQPMPPHRTLNLEGPDESDDLDGDDGDIVDDHADEADEGDEAADAFLAAAEQEGDCDVEADELEVCAI